MESAIWLLEYVAKTKGAEHLKIASRKLNSVQVQPWANCAMGRIIYSVTQDMMAKYMFDSCLTHVEIIYATYKVIELKHVFFI
jgi:hypothetical protein